MNRYLLTGTLTAAVALFAWQLLSNTVFGWHEATLRTFEDPAMAVALMHTVAPESGMYFHEQGVLASVSIIPGVTDRSTFMSMMLARQVALDLVAAFLLALVIARLRLPVLRGALLLGAVALAAGVVLELSNWNWYGFPIAYSLVNVLDTAINVALASAVLGWFARRLRPADAGVTTPQGRAVAA